MASSFSNLAPTNAALQSKANPTPLQTPAQPSWQTTLAENTSNIKIPTNINSGFMPSYNPFQTMTTPLSLPPSTLKPTSQTSSTGSIGGLSSPQVSTPQITPQVTPQINTQSQSTTPSTTPGAGYSNPATVQTGTPGATTSTPLSSTDPSIFQNSVGALATGSQNNNAQLAQNAQNIANQAGNAISNVGQSGARGEAGYLSTGTSPVGEGNAAILAQTTAAQQQAIAQGANMQLSGNAQGLTAQNQAQSGLSNAGQLTQPQAGAAFFGSPVSGNTVGSSDVIGTAVQNALQQASQPGADKWAIGQALASGAGGQLAYNQYMSAINQQSGGTYNPTQQSASSQATASQNANQGATYQGMATQIGTNVSTIAQQAPLLISALQSAGLNTSGNQTVNQLMKSGVAQSNPGAVTAIQGYVQEINTAIQQMVGRGDITPTDIGLQSGNLDVSNLPVNQLQSVFDNLQKAGQITQQVYQKIANSSGATPNAYMGGNTNPGNNATPVQAQSVLPSNTSGYQNAGIGTIANIGSWVLNTAQNLGGDILGFIAGKI